MTGNIQRERVGGDWRTVNGLLTDFPKQLIDPIGLNARAVNTNFEAVS